MKKDDPRVANQVVVTSFQIRLFLYYERASFNIWMMEVQATGRDQCMFVLLRITNTVGPVDLALAFVFLVLQ